MTKENETHPLPEAGGVAWTDIYSPGGAKISLTARAEDPKQALDQLLDGVQYALKEKGCTARPPGMQAPAETPPATIERQEVGGFADAFVPVNATTLPAGEPVQTLPGEETMQVEAFEAQVTGGGKAIYKAFGGRYKKFGVTVWPEVMETIYPEADTIPTGTRWDANPQYTAVIQMNEKGNPQKVLSFR